MKLVAFSVENYRSITNARKISLSNYSILIGANNAGKSNILHALALGMGGLSDWVVSLRRLPDGRLMRTGSSTHLNRAPVKYHWETDFPIGKQRSAKPEACTKIVLEFQLDDDELAKFRAEIGSVLNGTLPILLSFGKNSFDLSVQKPGRGHATLNKKSAKIAAFVAERLRFDYIPAIRTSESASAVISRLVEKQLRVIENNPDYIAALDKIEQLQSPIFEEIGLAIQRTVANFLPAVKSVKIQPIREARNLALRRQVEILVDDGSLTKLSRKGDGVQSLAALALMRHAAEESSSGRQSGLIIAIEEPESHLHPRAIHELRAVVESISEISQVVLTTHSPLFVRVANLSSTIVVSNSRAKAAEHVSEIRDALGVRFSDNLQNARLVLIVEGKDDLIALRAIISNRSATIQQAIGDGVVTFDDLGGASSLSQKASFYQSAACSVQAFLDNDSSGKLAVDKAVKSRSIILADVNLATMPGRDESELEDLYDTNVYRDAFFGEFGVDVKKKPVGKARKWSDLVGRQFVDAGKPWSDEIKAQCKLWLCHFAAANAADILRSSTEGSVSAFVASIERKIAAF